MSIARVASSIASRIAIGFAGVALVLAAAPVARADLAGGGAPDPMPQLVPQPVSTTVEHRQFTLAPSSRIVVNDQGARAVADQLAGYLRPATGYPLPVVSGYARHGDISLALSRSIPTPGDEGYQLSASERGLSLTAKTPHGLFNGVQTIRQLLPPWIESPTVQHTTSTMPAVQITDYPRYEYRGVMLDIARHFQPPSAVNKLIDEASAYKMNVLHLHVSDDQGFRIAINGFPNLTAIGGQGSVGTHGREMDPGGYWTQDDYRGVVAYAAAHFMTVVPEVDTPGHNNAIIMSEYNDTANLLDPHSINCSVNDPPVWNYSGDVGYSALCPESEDTWTVLGAIIDQLTAMSPGPYYDLGGDEVPSTLLSHDRYAALVNREFGVVAAHGKIPMGWAEISGQGTTPPAGGVAQYWNPASGSQPGTETATNAVAKHMKIVMSPANHAYLDQKYARGVPQSLGLTWACNRGCDVDQFYNWDPADYVDGVTDDNVIGLEGAMWGETVVTYSDVEYMVLPRLLALAELAWSPKADRSSLTSPAYQDFLPRLAAQGARFTAAGENFHPTPEVPWRLDLVAGDASLWQDQVSGTLATLSAPGVAAGDVTATIDWGDGSASAGTVSGTAASDATVNGAYAIGGNHTYAHPGVHQATVTVSAPGRAPAAITITLH